MLKERVAYLGFILCLFSAVNKSLAQSSYPAYSSIEVHTLRGVDAKDTEKDQTPNSWNIEFLSQPKLGLKSVQAENKAVFISQTQCEIYDFNTQEWNVKSLSKPRRNIAAASNGFVTYLAGGCTGPVSKPDFTSKIDVYHSNTDSWKTGKLSVARTVGACISAGNKLIFAGGITNKGLSDVVDVFNVATAKRETYHLSEPRTAMAVTVAGNKVIFAGGVNVNHSPSNAIDIFDIDNNKWSVEKLQEKRAGMAVTAIGNLIFFAGGVSGESYLNIVDIYNINTAQWEITTLSEAKTNMTVATANDKVYLAGGVINKNGLLSSKVEIYDVQTGKWDVHILEAPRTGMAVGVTAHKLLFAGGAENEEANSTDRIEILDIESGTWSVEHLYEPRMGMASASYDNKVIFAGGTTTSYPFPEYKEASGVVDIYTDPTVTLVSQPNSLQLPCLHNNGKTYVYLDLSKYRNCAVNITVLDANSRAVFSTPILPSKYNLQEIDVTAVPKGNYQLLAEAAGYHPMLRSFRIGEPSDEPLEVNPSLITIASK